MNKFSAFRSQCECLCVFLSACVCACELVAGIKDVMQDYPAGRLPTSTAEEEMARQRGWRAADGEMEGAADSCRRVKEEEFMNKTCICSTIGKRFYSCNYVEKM